MNLWYFIDDQVVRLQCLKFWNTYIRRQWHLNTCIMDVSRLQITCSKQEMGAHTYTIKHTYAHSRAVQEHTYVTCHKNRTYKSMNKQGGIQFNASLHFLLLSFAKFTVLGCMVIDRAFWRSECFGEFWTLKFCLFYQLSNVNSHCWLSFLSVQLHLLSVIYLCSLWLHASRSSGTWRGKYFKSVLKSIL